MKFPGGITKSTKKLERSFLADSMYTLGPMHVIEAGFYLPSRANTSRIHWSKQHRHASEQRELGQMLTRRSLGPVEGGKWLVTFKRIAPCPLDSDNLASAFKSIRDGVADALGTDDKWMGNIEWAYDQTKAKAYGIRIEITRRAD